MNRKLKVLVADDIERLAQNIVDVVSVNENVGEVKMVKNGKELIDTIVEWEPDIVFTDNQMPILNGVDVILQIKMMTDYPNKPQFILVTADPDPEIMRLGMKNNFFVEYKPISEEDINQHIEIYLDSQENTKQEIKEETQEIRKKEGFFKKLLNNL